MGSLQRTVCAGAGIRWCHPYRLLPLSFPGLASPFLASGRKESWPLPPATNGLGSRDSHCLLLLRKCVRDDIDCGCSGQPATLRLYPSEQCYISGPHLKQEIRWGLWWSFLRAHEISGREFFKGKTQLRQKMATLGLQEHSRQIAEGCGRGKGGEDMWLVVDSSLCTIDYIIHVRSGLGNLGENNADFEVFSRQP